MLSLKECLGSQYPNGWKFGGVDMADKAICLLPQIIWCAQNRKIMTYGDLAVNVGMPQEYLKGNPLAKTAGLLAGAIGDYCMAEKLPPLNVLLVRKESRLPGNGVAFYLKQYDIPDYASLDEHGKRTVLARTVYPLVFNADVWESVLAQNGFIPKEFSSYIGMQSGND